MGSQKWQGKRWSELGIGFLCQKIQTFQPQAFIKYLRAMKLNGQGWICGIVVLASFTWPCTGMLSYPGCAELQAASHPQTQMPGLFLSPLPPLAGISVLLLTGCSKQHHFKMSFSCTFYGLCWGCFWWAFCSVAQTMTPCVVWMPGRIWLPCSSVAFPPMISGHAVSPCHSKMVAITFPSSV